MVGSTPKFDRFNQSRFFWGVLLAALVGCFVGSVSLIGYQLFTRVRTASAPAFATLIVSPEKTILDQVNRYDGSMKGRIAVLTYAEPRVRQLVNSFTGGSAWAKSNQTLLVIPKKGEESIVISDADKITSTLSLMAQSDDSHRFPFIPILVLAGFCLGSVLRPSNTSLLAMTSLGVFAAAYKVTHICPVCPVLRFIGIPYEQLAFAFFLLATISLATFPAQRSLIFSVGACACAAIGFQLSLFYGNHDLCIPCTTMALANGSILATCIARLRLETLQVPPLKVRLLVPGLATSAFIASGYIASPSSKALTAGAEPHSPPPVSLRGKATTYIHLQTKPSREVVAIVSDTCHACQFAKEWFLTHPNIPVRIVKLCGVGEKSEGSESIPSQPSRINSVPRILFTDHSQIISDHQGWSQGADWQLMLESDIKSFLSVQKQSG